MSKRTAPETLLSLSQLAPQVGVSYATLLKIVTEGVITPDAHCGRMGLFKLTRVQAIREKIKTSVRSYGYGYHGWKPKSELGPDASIDNLAATLQ